MFPLQPNLAPLKGFLIEDLFFQARTCDTGCFYAAEAVGVSPGDFVLWDGGAGEFRRMVKQERSFDLEVLGSSGIRRLCIDMGHHRPCRRCSSMDDPVDFGIVARKGRVVDGYFFRDKGKKGKLDKL